MGRRPYFFKVEHVDKGTGERSLEKPRLMIIADTAFSPGRKALFLKSCDTILAEVGFDESDMLLWEKARERAEAIAGRSGIVEWDGR